MPSINAAGLALIKNFESCRLEAYDDGTGVLTIGWGHTGPDVTPETVWTQEQADAALEADLEKFEVGVNSMVSRNLNTNQFSALVSFAYNVGLGALKNSTLLRLVNAAEYTAASNQFPEWVNGANGPLPGLVRRRAAERALFRTRPASPWTLV